MHNLDFIQMFLNVFVFSLALVYGVAYLKKKFFTKDDFYFEDESVYKLVFKFDNKSKLKCEDVECWSIEDEITEIYYKNGDCEFIKNNEYTSFKASLIVDKISKPIEEGKKSKGGLNDAPKEKRPKAPKPQKPIKKESGIES